MHLRTRRLLTGATLTLIAIALGTSQAAAAPTKTIHKISACGYTATKPGIYELTQSVADAGSGTCITLNGDNITLYLDSHTITGTGTDTCLLVGGGISGLYVGDAVVGGTMPKPGAKKKVKPAKPATLTNCRFGLHVLGTSGTTVGNLDIVAPTSVGVYEENSAGMNLSRINVPMHAANPAYGIILKAGADNVVTDSTVNYDGTNNAFFVTSEVGDSFLRVTVKDTYNANGSAGVGFLDVTSSRNTYSHCASTGQTDGFILVPQGAGPVTATYNTATGSSANNGSVGFLFVGAYQQSDTASPYHTVVSHNTANGFDTGFDDQTSTSFAVAEKWIDNTADNYAAIGFKMALPTNYTMTGNIADANTSGKKYIGGTSYGFYLAGQTSFSPFALFANNQAYDSRFGFFANGYTVGGKGNIGKRNLYNSVGVEIGG